VSYRLQYMVMTFILTVVFTVFAVRLVSFETRDNKIKTEIKGNATKFFTYIANLDYKNARKLCGPAVLNNIDYEKSGEYKEKLIKLRVYDVDIDRMFYVDNYVEADMAVRFKYDEDDVDTLWYKVIYDKNSRKILSINPIDFMPRGYSKLKESDKEKITETCEEYLWLVSKGEYEKAGRLLAGEARVQQERYIEQLPKGGVPINPDKINIKVLGKSYNNIAVVDMSYIDLSADKSIYKVQTFIKLVKCGEDWKIYNIYIIGRNKVK